MRTIEQFLDRTKDYKNLEYIYTDFGYIAWCVSTGENVQILFIEARETGKGLGKVLVKLMCELIKPYNSVFVFRLKQNATAGKFYRKLGFKETVVKGIYKEDAVIGTVSFNELKNICQNL